MNRSPAEIRDRWLNYGRRYARYPTLWDSSLAFASGPLAPEAGTLQDYSGRTAGAAWSVGAGDVPKYVQGSVRGGSFWAGRYDGSDDIAVLPKDFPLTGCAISLWANMVSQTANQALFGSFFNTKANLCTLFCASGTWYWDHGGETVGSARLSFTFPAGTAGSWHHIVAVAVVGIGQSIYYDGKLLASNSGSTPTRGTNASAWIGNNYRNFCFSGGIASFAVFSSLTPDETSILARHPLEAYRVEVPKYWMFPTATTHLWPWQIRRSRRVRGHR